MKSGVVSIDGTRIAGNASPEVNCHFEEIAREILAEVKATDEAEDEEFGEERGDELPEQLRTPEGRREFLRQAAKSSWPTSNAEESARIEEPNRRPGPRSGASDELRSRSGS